MRDDEFHQLRLSAVARALLDVPQLADDVARRAAGNRWDVGADDPSERVGRIALVVANEPGALGALSTVIARNEGNITNLKITNRTQQFWEMLIDVEVRDLKHLTNVIAALRATPAINSAERARG